MPDAPADSAGPDHRDLLLALCRAWLGRGLARRLALRAAGLESGYVGLGGAAEALRGDERVIATDLGLQAFAS